MTANQTRTSTETAIRRIASHGGVVHTADVLRMGIHPRTLYKLRDDGVLEQLSRGVYRLANLEPVSNPDLVTVAARCPQAVVCLVSALAFHEITTQVPHQVIIAIAKGAETPRLEHPPIRVHRFSGESLTSGIELHPTDGVTVRVFSPEKTLADCFKFRNKLGMDVVLEAMKLYRDRKRFDVQTLLKYARVCRVERIMRPYLEAML